MQKPLFLASKIIVYVIYSLQSETKKNRWVSYHDFMVDDPSNRHFNWLNIELFGSICKLTLLWWRMIQSGWMIFLISSDFWQTNGCFKLFLGRIRFFNINYSWKTPILVYYLLSSIYLRFISCSWIIRLYFSSILCINQHKLFSEQLSNYVESKANKFFRGIIIV